MGLYSFITSLIMLAPGQTLAEGRLMRHLARMNIEDYWISGEKTDVVLRRMERQNYIIKIRERDGGGEETVEYVVGPRGRVEVGEKGVAGLVRGVYYDGVNQDLSKDEVERRLVRSLGDMVKEKVPRGEEMDGESGRNGEAATRSSGSRDNRRISNLRNGSGLANGEADSDDESESEEDEGD